MTFRPAPKPPVSPPPAKPRRVKRKNVKRAKANHERAYGDKASWIRAQPCLVCGYDVLPSHAAHVTSGGMGRKSDSTMLVPLCGMTMSLNPGCHADLHHAGVKTFEERHKVNLKTEAAKYEAEWQLASSFQSQPTLKKGSVK